MQWTLFFCAFLQQISSSSLLAHAQDEDLLVTEFSIIGHTSSSSGSTAAGIATSASGFESRASTGSGSTEAGMLERLNFFIAIFSLVVPKLYFGQKRFIHGVIC